LPQEIKDLGMVNSLVQEMLTEPESRLTLRPAIGIKPFKHETAAPKALIDLRGDAFRHTYACLGYPHFNPSHDLLTQKFRGNCFIGKLRVDSESQNTDLVGFFLDPQVDKVNVFVGLNHFAMDVVRIAGNEIVQSFQYGWIVVDPRPQEIRNRCEIGLQGMPQNGVHRGPCSGTAINVIKTCNLESWIMILKKNGKFNS
jgi:hypothetical protein